MCFVCPSVCCTRMVGRPLLKCCVLHRCVHGGNQGYHDTPIRPGKIFIFAHWIVVFKNVESTRPLHKRVEVCCRTRAGRGEAWVEGGDGCIDAWLINTARGALNECNLQVILLMYTWDYQCPIIVFYGKAGGPSSVVSFSH